MKKIAFIVNGSRKLSKELISLIESCEEHFETIKKTTSKQKEASVFAKELADSNTDYIIAVGGDGTVNEVINGIMMSTEKHPIIGVLPNGTGNDFLRGTKLSLNYSEFLNSLINSTTVKLDVLSVNTKNELLYFINIADVGFGGKVVQILDKQRKLIGGKTSYAIAILRAFIGFKRPNLKINTKDFNFDGEVLMVAICNGTIFGDGLTISPTANNNDGIINITLLGKVTLLDYIKNLKNLKTGKEIVHPEAHYFTATEILIENPKMDAVTEMDGEFLNDGNLLIKILPSEINLLHF